MSKNRDEAVEIRKAMAMGAAAGTIGTIAMTLGEKLEQRVTKRPNSYIPAHTMERLFGFKEKTDSKRNVRNLSMHYFNGIYSGVLRALMARAGMRGPFGSMLFLGVRLSLDQLMENATGIGAPPWKWPHDEQAIDFTHKAVYSFSTGTLVDRWVQPVQRSAHPEISRRIQRQSPRLLRRAA